MEVATATKICRTCGNEKPISNNPKESAFDKRHKRPSFRRDCKDCNRPKKTAISVRARRARGGQKRTPRDTERERRRRNTPEGKEHERRRKHIYYKTERYLKANNERNRKFRAEQPEKFKDGLLKYYYRKRGLSPDLVEAHIAVAKVKRVIRKKEQNG